MFNSEEDKLYEKIKKSAAVAIAALSVMTSALSFGASAGYSDTRDWNF